jgi:hypothetical protein
MPDKKYLLAAFAVALACFVLVTKYVKLTPGPLDSFSPRVQAAYDDSFQRLEFPRGVDEKYQRQVAGFLAGCLDSCLNRKMDFFGQRISLKNCRAGCACIANTRMTSQPTDFVAGQKKAPAEEVEEIKHCLGKPPEKTEKK